MQRQITVRFSGQTLVLNVHRGADRTKVRELFLQRLLDDPTWQRSVLQRDSSDFHTADFERFALIGRGPECTEFQCIISLPGGMIRSLDRADSSLKSNLNQNDVIRSDIRSMLSICTEKVQTLKTRCNDLVDRVKRDILISKGSRKFSLGVSGANTPNCSSYDMSSTPLPTGGEHSCESTSNADSEGRGAKRTE